MSGHASVSNGPCSECGLEFYDPDCRLCGDHEVSFFGGAQAQPDAESEAPKFTPGPWLPFIHEESNTIEVRGADDDPKNPVVDWSGFEGSTQSFAERKANAHLTAASPDLYYALKATHRLIAEGAAEGFRPDVGDWAGRLFTNQGRIYAALRKAEGCE